MRAIQARDNLRCTLEGEEPEAQDFNYQLRTQKNLGMARGIVYSFDDLKGLIGGLQQKLTKEGN